jgi:predicted NBD/HSP70 family sugar kinase/transcriptional regulator with XRE-family HTH domain
LTGPSAQHVLENDDAFKEEFEVLDEPSDPDLRGPYEDRVNSLRLLSLAKATRKSRKLTQRQVASIMGTTQSAVSDLESGRIDAHLTTWQRYTRALGKHFSFSIADVYAATPSGPSTSVPKPLSITEFMLSPVLTELCMMARPQDAAGISRETRLPEPLVTRVLARLEEAGWAEATVQGKLRSFRLRDDAAHVIGLSLHRDRIVGVLVDMNGTPLSEAEVSPLTKPTPDIVISEAVRLVGRLFDKSRKSGKKVLGVGVSLAGIVEANTGAVTYAPDLASAEHGWNGVALEKRLQKQIQTNVQQSLRVAVENDVNALALWRSRRRGSPAEPYADSMHRVKTTSAVVLMSGGGVGAGITVDGKIVSGSRSSAGELGHLVVDHRADAPACRAHRKHTGCLETVATVQGILRRLGLPCDTGLQRRQGLVEAEARLEEGDVGVRAAFFEAGRYLGRVLPLLSVLDPESIVVYANSYLHDEKYATARAFADGLSDALTKTDNAGVLVGDMPTPQWKVLDEDTGAIASAMAMLHSHFLNSPATWYPRLETAVERDSQLVLA